MMDCVDRVTTGAIIVTCLIGYSYCFVEMKFEWTFFFFVSLILFGSWIERRERLIRG